MRKRLAYLMLVLFLFANTEAHELLKLPFLVEHFASHNSEDGLSLGEFIHEHYGKSGGTKDAEHQNLPFKTHHAVAGFLVAELHQVPMIVNEQVPEIFKNEQNFGRPCDRLNCFPENIWQPPKNA